MKPLVLVLEDSLTERMALRTVLTTAGCIATGCGTLQQARETIRRRAFDLAVLDVMLPDGDGTELMEEIKSHPETAYMGTIMLLDTPELAREAAQRALARRCLLTKAVHSQDPDRLDQRADVELDGRQALSHRR
ncbi:MAG: response regulator [Verrucomicrobiota bacterium]